MVAAKGKGTDELLSTVIAVADESILASGINMNYGQDVEVEIGKLEGIISGNSLAEKYPPRWLAVKLLEDDEEIIEKVRQAGGG
jgi:ferrous iron transport protein B